MFDGLGNLGNLGTFAAPLIDKLKGVPGATLVVETLEAWWKQHPLRTAGLVAGEASRDFVMPIVRQNPLGMILGATILGALLVLSRPWRWLIRPALFVGLVPELVSQALKRMPVASWLAMFNSLQAKRRKRTAAAGPVPPARKTDDPSTP